MDDALHVIEEAVEPVLLKDDRNGRRDALPPYAEGAAYMAAWAPHPRVKLGNPSLALDSMRQDVEQLRMAACHGNGRMPPSIA